MENKSPYILLIEDNPDDVELTKLAFRKNNFANQIEVVYDGEEALQFLFEEQTRSVSTLGYPTIILMDLKLPKVQGLDILKEIKRDDTLKLIPVIILTSSQQEEDVITGYNLGANSFVRKPVDFQEFVSVVNNLGIYWLAVNKSILS